MFGAVPLISICFHLVFAEGIIYGYTGMDWKKVLG